MYLSLDHLADKKKERFWCQFANIPCMLANSRIRNKRPLDSSRHPASIDGSKKAKHYVRCRVWREIMFTVEFPSCHGNTKFLQLQRHFQALCVQFSEEFQRTFFQFGKYITTDCNHASRRFVCQLWGFHRGE